ncbi:MAG: stage V sporulation protein AE [Defluviitaleaceae bacterium]|nr:stage V sporulation protein AE [Defluviitaleaceae bacterium]
MDYIWAFLIGGAICVVGQILIDKTKLTSARILVFFVVAGVFLGGIGLYPRLVEFAGAGASVPILGFGNHLARGVMEEINSMGFIGILTGGIKAAAAGIMAAVLFSFLAALVFEPKAK